MSLPTAPAEQEPQVPEVDRDISPVLWMSTQTQALRTQCLDSLFLQSGCELVGERAFLDIPQRQGHEEIRGAVFSGEVQHL